MERLGQRHCYYGDPIKSRILSGGTRILRNMGGDELALRALGTFGFALTVLAMPVAANAQRVIHSDEKGARQLVAQSHESKKLVARARTE